MEEFPKCWNYWEYNSYKDLGEEARWDAEEWHSGELEADYRKWARRPYWSADECAALTFGKDPHQVNWDAVQDYLGLSRFAGYYEMLRERLLTAQGNKELPERIHPFEFFAWARRHEIDFPNELEKAVLKNDVDIEELEQQCEQLKQRHEELRRENQRLRANEVDSTQLQQRCEQLEQRHGELRRENQELRYELDQLRTSTPPQLEELSTKEPSTKERKSLNKLIIGMAIAGYKWDPKALRSAVTKEITDDLQKQELHLSQDTILRYLREAAEELP
jgi:hypothetical protein